MARRAGVNLACAIPGCQFEAAPPVAYLDGVSPLWAPKRLAERLAGVERPAVA